MRLARWPHDRGAGLEPDLDDDDAASEIARLKLRLQGQARVIRRQQAALTHSQTIFEGAAAAARVGVWQCDLSNETLCWTNQVYDMFDLPRGSRLDRGRTLTCYAPASLALLQELRSKAIADRSGFAMDAEIVTPKGTHRWIRLTATVACDNGVAVRIFGMKQDITTEKILAERTRYLADFDVLTGLSNRRAFQTVLSALDDVGGDKAPFGALILIDLDGFKQINDRFGHAAGDECLRQAAVRLKSVCRDACLVARIGGDEFAVLVRPPLHRDAVERLAATIVETLREPYIGLDRSPTGGASVGFSCVGSSRSTELFARADAALYAAKAAGRNTFRMFNPETRPWSPREPSPIEEQWREQA